MQRFEVNRTAFDQWRVAEQPARELQAGEVRLGIEFFAFTANNMTYAAAGDQLGYWQFFPVADDPAWGVIPVWAFAQVTESTVADIPVGERLYGYFPPAGELIIQPMKISAVALFDGAPHRQALPPLYNRYQRMGTEREANADVLERLQVLLGPLYMTSYCLWDQLHQNGWYGAGQVVVVSASSKTSLGLAQALADDDQSPAVVGLTSAANRDFVTGTGLYDSTLSYDAVGELPRRPTVVVDMAGNAATKRALREHLGDELRYFISVGLTHWDQAGGGLGGDQDRHEWFFAPTYILERSGDGSAGDFQQRGQAFVRDAAARAMGWLQLDEVTDLAALGECYAQICAGRMDPSRGLICSP